MSMPIPLSLPLLLVIAVGGAAGAFFRYTLSGTIQSRIGGTFPWGTLAVNGGGCVFAGIAAAAAAGSGVPGVSNLSGASAFLLPGLLGGLTTFSTFAGDVVALADSGSPRKAMLYIAATMVMVLGGASAGLFLGEALLT